VTFVEGVVWFAGFVALVEGAVLFGVVAFVGWVTFVEGVVWFAGFVTFVEGSVLFGVVAFAGWVTFVEGSVLFGVVWFAGFVTLVEGSVLLGTVSLMGFVTLVGGSVLFGVVVFGTVGWVIFWVVPFPLDTFVSFLFLYSTQVFLIVFQIGSSGGHYWHSLSSLLQ